MLVKDLSITQELLSNTSFEVNLLLVNLTLEEIKELYKLQSNNYSLSFTVTNKEDKTDAQKSREQVIQNLKDQVRKQIDNAIVNLGIMTKVNVQGIPTLIVQEVIDYYLDKGYICKTTCDQQMVILW